MIHFQADLLLALKSVEEDYVAFHFRVRRFDRDLAPRRQIGGPEDRRHTAACRDAFNPVVIELILKTNRGHKLRRTRPPICTLEDDPLGRHKEPVRSSLEGLRG